VHQLSRLEAAPQPHFQPPQQAFQPAQQAYQAPQQQAYQPPQQAHQPPQQVYHPPQQAFQPAQPAYQPPQQQTHQAPHFAPPPQATQFAPPPVPQMQPPAHGQGYPAAPPHGPSGATGGMYSPSQHPPAGPESLRAPAGTIEAELGAHSPSNFYKTLSGNDIVEHGGIFVATYNIPRLDQRVQLRVHLPGGYHFDATGTVRWTREARDNPDAPPGFGVQFHGITAEQRMLIQRYVRNREPLFYDDL
jgi:hypothetical protein